MMYYNEMTHSEDDYRWSTVFWKFNRVHSISAKIVTSLFEQERRLLRVQVKIFSTFTETCYSKHLKQEVFS